MIDIRQTKRYVDYMQNVGWIVERKDRVNYFIKKIPVIGSFIKIQRPQKLDFNQINRIAKKHRAFQIVIEPFDFAQGKPLIKRGFKLTKSPYLPSKTIEIDLTKTENQLLGEMHHKTRYNIKIAKRNKLQVTSSSDMNSFVELWLAAQPSRRLLKLGKSIHALHSAFGKNSHLLLAHKSNKLLAGILMPETGSVAYYMYAAATPEGKKLFAPTLVTWEAIKLAKKLKCKLFDLEGVYDDRFPLKSWLGFTRFKKSFGGKEAVYPGAFTKWRLPL
ncbi:hypothetical protein A3D84_03820 [Candidatus Woesebacteria bacterium RIFCSPHIGHO2_02_FULL_42_20]|uniref:BioF2-like acetyltransferase domain-containing protein n=1 Tax=Candidatus Woesebacteria bacterium RIFCSPHIGHO2_12_FULL_41_24 TaxID=1802510 RepID=A0A1F8AU87_9BACT|nr:MAG: hypothetical protein A2W15_03975 [Candidatus Woesebacteria bacterium RBG_16_41_13]OGM30091.1 MAG: hypothetical protein A2873_00500 [Candidatus Woesebacteria bacterium RIFCSPHIGHO2_01_FULL_42_80]OGM35660.1 MAG: hypothetical protein A3D84_03820 [Candidatus Woesebacteria bacterium RIFCSPHIGHO2_02_FULL_42_20]OGM55271.1 MAG: hypothetical protein A3E44_03230 [Candidatus Woesebacteria bacterium RIFCSPHIGHO2_12_FULL_41_24]OGM66815.1 MAG: hypothetical protein A2969_00190 [Candidatus Woesebacteri